jgi:isopentenyl phosphate kinase
MVNKNQKSKIKNLKFLKLGGSLITDKTRPHTARFDVIHRLAQEIAIARQHSPGMGLILGHGSGSFGHVPAQKYATRQGVHTTEEWQGFVEVWQEASALNCLVMDALIEAGLPALSFSPSTSITSRQGKVAAWDMHPLKSALQVALLPVIYGDVTFDLVLGGTILSTEDLFSHLAMVLSPSHILLAGLEPGVWSDYPQCTRLVHEITPENLPDVAPSLVGSAAPDVTGGMADKVRQSLRLAQRIPGLRVNIFSGDTPGLVAKALRGESPGTLIHN